MEIVSWFFGLMGSLLVIFFLGTVWYWMKYNKVEERRLRTAEKWKILGYLFMIIGIWFTCGVLGPPGTALRPERSYLKSAISMSYMVMTFFVLGFLSIFIGQYKTYKSKQK
jgi:hypothetical protein